MILLISIFIIKDSNAISNKHIFIDSIINKINLIDLVSEKEWNLIIKKRLLKIWLLIID